MKTVIRSGNGNEQLYQYLRTDSVLATASTPGKEFYCQYLETEFYCRYQETKSSTARIGNRVLYCQYPGTEFYR